MRADFSKNLPGSDVPKDTSDRDVTCSMCVT